MIMDNVILVGIVLSLILCFCICLFYTASRKDYDDNDIFFNLVFGTLLINIIFWAVGYLIFWILKLIFN